MDYTIEELEELVFTKSVPYRDSTAFQSALAHIKDTDIEIYKTLLYTECNEMGMI